MDGNALSIVVLHPPLHPLWPIEREWHYLTLSKRLLAQAGLTFRFCTQLNKKTLECDVMMVSSRFFDIINKSESERRAILETLDRLKRKIRAVIWFDMGDSSGKTEFEVLPYVSLYLKKQLLKDRALYQGRAFYSGRLFTDYYHREHGVNDDHPQFDFTPLNQELRGKVVLGWNLGLSDFRRGGFILRSWYFLRDHFEAAFGGNHSLQWTEPETFRDINLLGCFNLDFERTTVRFQRKRAVEILTASNWPKVIAGEKLPARQYLHNLKRSKIVLSLFGVGEVCYREYEAFIAGAAVLMPDMSHLETWPDMYHSHETYWPVKWDLSDLLESFQFLMDNEAQRIAIAKVAQDRYRKFWSAKGKEEFCVRLKSIIMKALNDKDNMASSP